MKSFDLLTVIDSVVVDSNPTDTIQNTEIFIFPNWVFLLLWFKCDEWKWVLFLFIPRVALKIGAIQSLTFGTLFIIKELVPKRETSIKNIMKKHSSYPFRKICQKMTSNNTFRLSMQVTFLYYRKNMENFLTLEIPWFWHLMGLH